MPSEREVCWHGGRRGCGHGAGSRQRRGEAVPCEGVRWNLEEEAGEGRKESKLI